MPRASQVSDALQGHRLERTQVADAPLRGDDDRRWVEQAVSAIRSEASRTADTNVFAISLPVEWGVDLYLKDESAHPTGSLKHRLARSLFLYGLCNGAIHADTTVVESSSGSTAVSEAYFAQMLGLPFVAVIPRATSPEKVLLIESYGGRCHFVERPEDARAASQQLAVDLGGHYMDQFTNAERATDWRSNNNIAASVFDQLAGEPHPVPAWVIVGAGTGGTSATIGRYLRYCGLDTRLCVVDPEGSVYFDAWTAQDWTLTGSPASRIEGIGRPQVEPSFIPTVVDRMVRVPDAASIAAIRDLETRLGRRVGGSTGTNLWAAYGLIAEMIDQGIRGSVVTLLCDGGDRYASSLYDDDWLRTRGIDVAPYATAIDTFYTSGRLDLG